MNSANENQNQATCEKNDLSLNKNEKENKSGKSNSELMAEFFAIVSEDDKNK